MLPEIGLILDAGTGMFRVRDLIQTSTLDIVLSHAHLDHSIGLTFLFDILWDKDVEAVRVHGSASAIETIENHLFSKLLFPARPDFEFVELVDSWALGDVQIHSFPLQHPGGAHGFRLEREMGSSVRLLAYVTDTTAAPEAEYLEHIEDVDTLIHECYFPDGWEERAALTGHSCLTPVAEIAKLTRSKATYLIHINPLLEEDPPFDLSSAREIYPNLHLTRDQMVIDVLE